MNLNPDSVRAVLLYLEENLKLGEHLTSIQIANGILKENGIVCGDNDEIVYAIKQLNDNYMIDAKPLYKRISNTSFFVFDITPRGHEFLNNIRDDGIWKTTKEQSKKVGTTALSILSQIATTIITQKITGL